MIKLKLVISILFLFTSLNFAQLIVKDQEVSPNTLLQVNDEGTSGSITIPSLSTIVSNTNKLYNLSGMLYWNGSALGTAESAGGWTHSGTSIYPTTLTDNIGIGVLSPTTKLDVRGPTVDDDAIISLGNSDLSHQLTIFPGRSSDPNPFIRWKKGDPLRFAVDPGSPSFFTELMRIESNGNVGIGTTNPSSKLEVNGQVKITGGAPANGKVLTSDAAGLATWQDNANPKIGFNARLTNNINAATFTETQLQDFSETFDDGNNFNPVTGVFIIPATGVYQFSLNVSWSSTSTLSDIPTSIRIKVNSTIIRQMTHKVQLNSSWGSTTFISGIVKANSSDQITFTVLYSSSAQVTVNGGLSNTSTNVSGFRIY